MPKKIVLFIILFLLPACLIKSITCEYPDNDLSITYDEHNNVSVDSKFIGSGTAKRLSSYVMLEGGEYKDMSAVEYPEKLAEKYKGKACPEYMWICEFSESYLSASARTVIRSVFSDNKTILHLNKRQLYIYTDDEYKKSPIREYEGGKLTNEWEDNYEKYYDECGGNADWGILSFIPQAWGTVCGGSRDVVVSGVDIIAGDEGYKFYIYYNTDCFLGHYDGPFTAYNVNCNELSEELFVYANLIESYKKCDENDQSCKKDVVTNLNNSEDNLKGICKSFYDRYDFNEAQTPCLNTCLRLKTKLNEYRQGTDLYEDYSNITDDACTISQDVITMIYNVLKWAKYIAPVLVIILSILDFIKAMAAQSDDDMKKAQGKFVKRLIVSALLFLIPLIINFVLKTFGFYHSGCDVTDLF